MRGGSTVRILALFLAALVLAGCASAGKAPSETTIDGGPGDVFLRAGQNVAEIEGFLVRYPEGSQMRHAAEFLVRSLPLSDALCMDEQALAEHVEYAFLARRSMPWGDAPPYDVFLRFVVPHRMSQEPVQAYRAQFYKELVPRLRGVAKVREAVRLVNAWCFEKARFEPSSRQDQGPLTTIVRGNGRCEELGILLVAALRSVGIPARACSVPLWRHTEGNHLWVEVYDQGRWRFIGAGELESDYDLAWFEPALHTAPFLYSLAYGNSTTGLEHEEIAHTRLRSTLINRTPDYAANGEAAISVVSGGEPVPDVPVALHTYNFASPRAFLLSRTAADGTAEIEIGTGVFMATASSEKGRDYVFLQVEAGGRTESVLDLDKDRMFEGEAFMPFESDPNLQRLIQKTYNKARTAAEKRIAAFDEKRKKSFAAAAEAARRASEPDSKELAIALEGAGRNAPELVRALMTVPEENRSMLVRLIAGMDVKDLAQCRADGLIANVELAAAARERLKKRGILEYGDDIFERHVLSERVLYEPFTHWRSALVERFTGLEHSTSLDEIVTGVSRATRNLAAIEAGLLGSTPSPGTVFSSGLHRRGRRDAQVAAAAALRALGVPARGLHDWSWAEYFDGKKWRPFHPWLEEAPEGMESYYEPWAELHVAFTMKGEPVQPGSLQYARDFMVGRYDDRIGLSGLDAVRSGEKDGRVVISLPAGERWLSSGRRDAEGRPYLRLERIELKPGERRHVRRELGVPMNPSIPKGTARPRPEERSGSR